MQQVFLSFTCHPHPDHIAESELLHRRVSVVIDALDSYLRKGWGSGKAPQLRSRLAADFRGWQRGSAHTKKHSNDW